jgi:hypothetical protein
MLEYTPMVISNWVKYSIKDEKVIILLLLAEFWTIWIESINSSIRINNFFLGSNHDININVTKLNYLNPIHYMKNFKPNSNDECQALGCYMSDSVLIAIISLVFFFFLVFHVISFWQFKLYLKNGIHKYEKSSNFTFLLNLISVNMMDLFFKTFGIIILFTLMNKILNGFFESYDILLVTICVLFFLLFIALYIYQISYIILYFKISKRDTFRYDKFSQYYDSYLFIIKLLISINENLLILNANKKFSAFIIFLDIFLICVIYIFIVASLRNTLVLGNISLIGNYNINIVRFFLSFYLVVIITLFTIFTIFNIHNLILTCFLAIILTLTLTAYIVYRIKVCLYKDKEYIYLLMHLLTMHFENEKHKIEIQKELIKIKYFHSIYCDGKKIRSVCKICDFHGYSLKWDENNFLDFIFLLFEVSEKMYKYFSDEEKKIYNFSYLIFKHIYNHYKKLSSFEVVYKTKQLLAIEKNKKTSYRYNLELYYMMMNRQNENNVKIFYAYKNYDILHSKLNDSINIVEDLAQTINSNVKRDLYKQTQELYANKVKIIECMSTLNSCKNTHSDLFSFTIAKIIFEKLFNVELGKFISNLYELEELGPKDDFLKEHYYNDQFLVVSYQVAAEKMIIKKGSRRFVNSQNKSIEDIFPKKFKSIGRNILQKKIASNSEGFKFDFIIETNQEYVQEIKFDCKMYKSFDLQEIFIICNFEVTNEDIIIFEVANKHHGLDMEYFENNLVTFSPGVEKLLFLKPRWISSESSLLTQKTQLSFDDIFLKHSQVSFVSSFKLTSQHSEVFEGYILKYSSYFDSIYPILIETGNNSQESSSVNESIKEIKKMTARNFSVNLKINTKLIFPKNDDYEYKIYSLQLENNKRGSLHRFPEIFSTINNFWTKSKVVIEKDDTVSNDNNNKFYLNEPSLNSVSSNMSKDSRSIINKIHGGRLAHNLISSSKMNRFTIITLTINIIIVIYSLIFLIIGMIGNSKLNSLHNLKTSFYSFEHYFYQTTLSLFYNAGIYKNNTDDMSEYTVNSYWNKFSFLNLSLSVGDYANSELSPKIDELKYKMNELQFFVFNSSFHETLQTIFDVQTSQNILIVESLDIQKLSTSFFGSVTMFMNSAKSAVFYTTTTPIYIFSFNMATGDFDFSQIWHKNISNVQRAVYEIVINYPKYYDNFNGIGNKIKILYNKEVGKIFETNFNLTIILIVLHIILLVVSIGAIHHLVKTIHTSNTTFALLVNGEWTKFILCKLDVLKNLNQFYREEPDKLHNKYTKILNNMSILNKIQSSKALKNTSDFLKKPVEIKEDSEKKVLIEKQSKIRLSKLIFPLIRLLLSIFILYLIYSLSLVILLNMTYKQLVNSNNYYDNHINVDNNMMNYVLLLQTLLFSNQTDTSLAKFLQRNSSFSYTLESSEGYISKLFKRTLELKSYLEIMRRTSPLLLDIGIESDRLSDCNFLYSNLRDSVFEKLSLNYQPNELKDTLTKVCNSYPIMKANTFDNIVNEMDYTIFKLIKEYDKVYGNYELAKRINDYDNFFDMFTITVLILRPIQSYLIDNVILNKIVETLNNYLITIMSYLICNIFVEVIIFISISRLLINRVLQISKEINCLTKSLAS